MENPSQSPNPLLLPPSVMRLISLHITNKMPEFLNKLTEKYGLSHNNSNIEVHSLDSFIISDMKIHSVFKALKIQTCWRMKRISRIFKLRQKKLKHRGYIIKELVESEEKFQKSLETVIDKVQNVCEKNEILTKDEIHIVFSHLNNIMLFSKEIVKDLKLRFESFESKSSKFLDIFLTYFEFFKIYSPYCNNFPDAQNFIAFMRKDLEHPFTKLLKSLEFSKELQGLSLIDHLIKPVQRLPKYELLFKDLKKNTETSHPDYENISKALEKFLILNSENNKKMEDYLKQLRLFDLQKALITQNVNLFAKHRLFISEESLFLIKEECPIPITLYILSDLLLITEVSDGSLKLLHQLILDEASFICDLQNTRSYKWLFSVYGPIGGAIFMMDSKEHKKELIGLLEKTISKIKDLTFMKQTSQDILEARKTTLKLSLRIKTIGTFKRGVRGFKPYIIYVIEVKAMEKLFRLYIRFSELIEIEEIIRQKFPEMKIPHFPKTLGNFFNSQQLKVIESRKLLIEIFLQSILQKGEIAIMAKEVLNLLGLPNNFYTLDFNNQPWELFKNESIEGLFQELKTRFYKEKILLKNQEKDFKDHQMFEVSIKILDNTEVKMKISRNMRSIEICKEIARLINLTSWLDFKLFMINSSKKEELLLDDEEFVIKAMEFIQEKEANFLEKIAINVRKLKTLVLNSDYSLVFKKQGFFFKEIETSELEKDPKRLSLIFHQIFSEILDGKYFLSIMDYYFLGSIRLYTIYHAFFIDFHINSEEILNRILPLSIIKTQDKEKTFDCLNRIWQDLSHEIEFISEEAIEKKKREFQVQIAMKTLIAFMEKNRLFGSDLFWVNVLKKEKSEFLKIQPDFLWFVIKIEGISFLHPNERNKVLKEINMKDIEEYVIYPNCVKIRTKSEKFRLGTKKGFEIGDLMNKYMDFYKK